MPYINNDGFKNHGNSLMPGSMKEEEGEFCNLCGAWLSNEINLCEECVAEEQREKDTDTMEE